jgi:hypothetical protein
MTLTSSTALNGGESSGRPLGFLLHGGLLPGMSSREVPSRSLTLPPQASRPASPAVGGAATPQPYRAGVTADRIPAGPEGPSSLRRPW